MKKRASSERYIKHLLVDRNRMIRKKVVGFEYTEVIEKALKEIL